MYKFTFSLLHSTIRIEGRDNDAKSIIRNFEIGFRERTGMNQISIDFLPVADFLKDVEVEYHQESGYFIRVSTFFLFNPDPRPAKKVVDYIRKHSQMNSIASSPPPIPRTSTRIVEVINFDTKEFRYEALANDGGFIVLFHRSKTGGHGFMTRHLPPIPVVEYRFERIDDYKNLFVDAKNNCSEFLDLLFLGDMDVSKDTIDTFMRKCRIYGYSE
jgi:hypothetical protein